MFVGLFRGSCILKSVPINDIIATKVYQYFYLISAGGFKLKNKYKLTGRSGESIRLMLQKLKKYDLRILIVPCGKGFALSIL